MGDQFPLDVDFQGQLLKSLLGDDRGFAMAISDHIKPSYFTNQVHQWAWAHAQEYRRDYGAFPTISYLINLAYQHPAWKDVGTVTLVQVRERPVTDVEAVRAQALEFIRRCIFKQSIMDSRDLYNAGKFDAAYDHWREQARKLESVSWAPVKRSWIADEFVDRHILRQDPDYRGRAVATGIPDLDNILEGGLRPGEMGLWIAYSKAGKSSLLPSLGMVAARTQQKKVLHCVLEGGLRYIDQRYDTMLMDELYVNVKRGEVDSHKYATAYQEALRMRRTIVTRDFTDGWGCNVLHIEEELRDLEKNFEFVPDLLIVDYVDIMLSRDPTLQKPVEIQKAAAKDLKSLTAHGPGYALWTASQVQRPKGDDTDTIQDLLTSRHIADCYDKVRVADFIGSLNQTRAERQQGVMRLFAELYRDGAADKVIEIKAEFERMFFGPGRGLIAKSEAKSEPKADATTMRTKPFSYGALQQKQGM